MIKQKNFGSTNHIFFFICFVFLTNRNHHHHSVHFFAPTQQFFPHSLWKQLIKNWRIQKHYLEVQFSKFEVRKNKNSIDKLSVPQSVEKRSHIARKWNEIIIITEENNQFVVVFLHFKWWFTVRNQSSFFLAVAYFFFISALCSSPIHKHIKYNTKKKSNFHKSKKRKKNTAKREVLAKAKKKQQFYLWDE